MHTLFLGKLQNILLPSKNNSSTASNTCTSSVSTPLSALDSFQISEHISELLSPACGMSDEEKQAYFQKILAKLKSGQKLTGEEMRFLQAEHPEFYPQAARVQAMREGLETRLKCCRSKEAAQTIFADAMNSISDKDPMKEYLVAAYDTVMKDFKKSDAYKVLPDTEEEAKHSRKKTTSL